MRGFVKRTRRGFGLADIRVRTFQFSFVHGAAVLAALCCLLLSPSPARAQGTWVFAGVEIEGASDNSAESPTNFTIVSPSDGSITVRKHLQVGNQSEDSTFQFSFGGIPSTVASAGTVTVTTSGSKSGDGNLAASLGVVRLPRGSDGFEQAQTVVPAGMILDQSQTSDQKSASAPFPAATSFQAFYLVRFRSEGASVTYVFKREAGPPTVPTPRILNINPEEIDQFTEGAGLEINGTGFSNQAVVLWDDQRLEPNITGPARITVSIPSSLLQQGDKTVQIRVENEDGPDEGLRRSNALPLLIRAAAAEGPDVTVQYIEVVQVVQDDNNNVPLVANKPTVARVFIGTNPNNPVMQKTEAILRGFRDGQELPESPLTTGFPSSAMPREVFSRGIREKLNNSVNFRLPGAWTHQGGLTLQAEADPNFQIDRERSDNNALTDSFNFVSRRQLIFRYYEVCFQPAPGTDEPRCPDRDAVATFPSLLETVYPLPPGFLAYEPGAGPARTFRAMSLSSDDEVDRFSAWMETAVLYDNLKSDLQRDLRADQSVFWTPPGILEDGKTNAKGYTNPKGKASSGRFAAVSARSDGLEREVNLAHEIGHNLGLLHPDAADSCGADTQNQPEGYWPDPTTSRILVTGRASGIDEEGAGVGMEVRRSRFGVRSTFDKDLMTGVNSLTGCHQTEKWISPFHYTKLFEADGQPTAPPSNPSPLLPGDQEKELVAPGREQDGEQAIISGFVGLDGSGALNSIFAIDSTGEAPALSPTGAYCVELIGSSGALASHCFDLQFFIPETGAALSRKSFVFLMPFPEDVTRVTLSEGARELASLTKSANPPAMNFIQPQMGDRWEGGDQLVSWDGSDPDGDPLSYVVSTSADGGETWEALGIDLVTPQLTVNADRIRGGSNVLFRVQASDGLHNQEAVVGPITVVQQPLISVDSADVDLGPAVLPFGAEAEVKVRNTGSGVLTVVSVEVDNPVFEAVLPTAPFEVPAGVGVSILVHYNPTVLGVDTATLRITSDAGNQPTSEVMLHGRAVADDSPAIGVSTSPIDFGSVPLGSSSSAQVNVISLGVVPLATVYLVEGAGFQLGPEVVGAVLEQADNQTVEVRFSPTQALAYSGVLRINSNDPNRPAVEIALIGSGSAAIQPPGPAPVFTSAGIVNAASFAGDALTPDLIATLFGENLAMADATAQAGSSLPTELVGTTIEITDSAGMTRPAGLFGIFNGGTQINFYIDASTALGTAQLRVRRSDGQSSSVSVEIAQVVPGIFFAQNGAGQAVALAQFLRFRDGAAGPLELTFNPADLSLAPIDLGPAGDQVFLALFGTGIRLGSQITATVGGEAVPVSGFAAAAGFFGLDQVNVGPIPRNFVGRGPVEITLTVDGKTTNAVMVSFL